MPTPKNVRWVHSEWVCEGQDCVIHNPSDHAMSDFPVRYRWDRQFTERICPHGIGHPDPDDVAFFALEYPDHDISVHGCDGCCAKDGRVTRA